MSRDVMAYGFDCSLRVMVPFSNDNSGIDWVFNFNIERGRHGHDRMVVGFTTTYAISAYHH